MPKDPPVNAGGPAPGNDPGARVSGMQAKLHRWAVADSGRRFDDLYNLVCDPAFLPVAWERVAGNSGARTAGVDRYTVRGVIEQVGVTAFLGDLRDQLRQRTYRTLPVRERTIPGSPAGTDPACGPARNAGGVAKTEGRVAAQREHLAATQPDRAHELRRSAEDARSFAEHERREQ